MRDISEKELKKFIKEKPREEAVEEIRGKEKEKSEKEEFLAKEKKDIREKLEKEVAKMELAPELTEKAKKKAKQINDLDEEGKLMRLLKIAKEKGVAFSVKVAEKMDDPYVLDALHDILAQDERFKNFPK